MCIFNLLYLYRGTPGQTILSIEPDRESWHSRIHMQRAAAEQVRAAADRRVSGTPASAEEGTVSDGHEDSQVSARQNVIHVKN